MNVKLTSLLDDAFKSGLDTTEDITPGDSLLKPGERRDTAVLFLDLAGFTRFSGSLDHETVHDLTKSIMNELVKTAKRYGGYVDKIEGDRIMVLFGAVSSGENDSLRGLLCGFRMLEVVSLAGSVLSGSGVDLSARIGISSGPVTVAPDAIGHLTAMGNTVNIASRLEELAGLNSILVTGRVHSMCRDYAQWAPPSRFDIRGFDGPVIAWMPMAELKPGFTDSHEIPMVGRRKELASLTGFCRMAVERSTGTNPDGHPKHLIVEITGEAGTGKARLASQFLQGNCGGWLVLRGRSIQDGQPPHLLWSSVLSSLLGFHVRKSVSREEFNRRLSRCCSIQGLRRALPFLGRLIPADTDEAIPENISNQALTLETHLAVRDLIIELSRVSPVALLLEDTQWMDPTDGKLLRFLVNNCNTERPLLLILTGRDQEKDSPAGGLRSDGLYSIYRSIHLGELSFEESGEMASLIAAVYTGGEAHELSGEAMDLIWKFSSGNPFFLKELMMHLLESSVISLRKGLWRTNDTSMGVSLPDTLTGLLQSRLDNLSPELRKTLLLCSVLGNDFLRETYSMVCSTLGISPADDGVFRELCERQMLTTADSGEMQGYRFRHPLIQKTACESNLSHNLKLIHRAAARAIEELFGGEDEAISGKLAMHWEGAEDIEQACVWGLRAQKHAWENYQQEMVLHWGSKLLSHLPENSQDFLKVLELNASALGLTGKTDEQLDTLLRIRSSADALELPLWVARSRMLLGSFYFAGGSMDKARENLETSLATARQHGFREIESDTLGNLGILAGASGDLVEAGKCFSLARKLQAELGNKKGEASTLGNLGIMASRTGDTDGAAAYFQSALEIFRETGDTRSEALTLGNLGSIFHEAGKFREAAELYSRALAGAERTGDRRSRGIYLCNLGILNGDMGNEEASMDYYRRAMVVSRETGDPRFTGWTLSNMGCLVLRQGDAEKASGMLSEAVEIFESIGDNARLAPALGSLGHSLFLCGAIEDSVSVLNRTCEMIKQMRLPRSGFEDSLVAHRKALLETGTALGVPPLPEHWEDQAASNP